MDIISFLSGSSDKVYKFLCINGLVFIIVSLFYPLNKQHELELIAEDVLYKSEVFKSEVDSLDKAVKDLRNLISKNGEEIKRLRLKETIDSLKNEDFSAEILKLKDIVNDKNATLLIKKNKLAKQKIELEHINRKFDIIEKQGKSFENVYFWIMWIGIIMLSIGTIWWICSSLRKDDLVKAEISIKNE